MKKIVSLVLLMGILFSGCGKYEPTLPKKYDGVSFVELMELLDTKKVNINKDTILYETDELNVDSRIYGIDFDFNKPMKNLCTSKQGKYKTITDALLPNYLKEQIKHKKISFSYCEKKEKVLFGMFETKLHNPWQKYSRYVYYFIKSDDLTNEVNLALENGKKEQEKYKQNLKRDQEEYKEKARIRKQKYKEELRIKNVYKKNREKLDYMFVEKFNEPSKEQLKNGYIETSTFSTIDRYEFKHNNGNISDTIFHKQCDKVCSKYNHNLKVLNGNPTLVNKEHFIKTIDTQAKYGMYNFGVTCTCIGNKYRTKEYISNES